MVSKAKAAQDARAASENTALKAPGREDPNHQGAPDPSSMLDESQITLDREPTGALADRIKYIAGVLAHKDGIGTAVPIAEIIELFSEQDQIEIGRQIGVLDLEAFKNPLSFLQSEKERNPHPEVWRDGLSKADTDAVLLFREDKSLGGYLLATKLDDGKTVEIRRMATNKEHPIPGTGSFMLEAYLERLCESGVEQVTWQAESNSTGFYEKFAAKLVVEGRLIEDAPVKKGRFYRCQLRQTEDANV